ncbi:hypothetical protein AWB92_12540 [Mycobacterium sp. IEC1808]|uniref:DUF4276 family protein n=1 Tax=Mycobacterium sp. IEC1808 TaxID=1743230 RepID=UPI000A149516|nr:DUF4276 family protein [Mycobacterium sp. IEC1808]ORW93956.1 hypothetical protein AWB92_12540 [Mycobacterium sp. IEC1808]
MRDLQFALVREGNSDDGLVALIRVLLARTSVPGVIGGRRTYKGTTKEKLEQVLAEDVVPDLIFVHRDSDARNPAVRYTEIQGAADELDCTDKIVAVVPVQETEGWLLTDESAIRTVVGRPGGRAALGLPPIRQIEATANPKEILKEACKIASEKSGARLQKVAHQFPRHRATLLERLDVDGPVNQLVSWRRFVEDLSTAATRALSDISGT